MTFTVEMLKAEFDMHDAPEKGFVCWHFINSPAIRCALNFVMRVPAEHLTVIRFFFVQLGFAPSAAKTWIKVLCCVQTRWIFSRERRHTREYKKQPRTQRYKRTVINFKLKSIDFCVYDFAARSQSVLNGMCTRTMHVCRLSQYFFYCSLHAKRFTRAEIVSYVMVTVSNATCDVQCAVAIYSFHRIDFLPYRPIRGAYRRRNTNTFSFIVRMTEIRGSCLDCIVALVARKCERKRARTDT